MKTVKKWNVTPKEKAMYIDSLTPQLSLLRSKVKISQDELASLVGVSRQTYGDIERGLKKMSWNTFLSLILFFDNVHESHDVLHTLNAYPETLIVKFNDGKRYVHSQTAPPAPIVPAESPIKPNFDADNMLAQAYLSEIRRLISAVSKMIATLRETGPHRFEECCRRIFESAWNYLAECPESCNFCFSYYYTPCFRKYAEEQHRSLLKDFLSELEPHLTGISDNQDVVLMLFETLFSYSTNAAKSPEREKEIKKKAYVTYFALVDFYWKDRVKLDSRNMVL